MNIEVNYPQYQFGLQSYQCSAEREIKINRHNYKNGDEIVLADQK
jgi:hypothetical protein